MTTRILAFLLLPRLAEAHGIDAHRVQIELDGEVVRVAATPGVDAFPDADQNGDAILDRAEVAAARSVIRARVESAIHLEDARGMTPACEPMSISTVGSGEGHVRASLRCSFQSPPEALILRVDALGWLPYTLEAVRTRQVAPGRWTSDGDVMGATIPAGGGAVTLLERRPPNDLPTRGAVDAPRSTVPDIAGRASWLEVPLARGAVVVVVAALLAALGRAWMRLTDARRARRRTSPPPNPPFDTPTTLPNSRGPTR